MENKPIQRNVPVIYRSKEGVELIVGTANVYERDGSYYAEGSLTKENLNALFPLINTNDLEVSLGDDDDR